MKIQRTLLLVVIVGIFQTAYSQNIPEYSSTFESNKDLVELRIQALPQKATRYHFSETDKKTTGDRVFLDIRIEDEFSLVPVSFSEDIFGVKFQQGTAMWKRIFIIEDGLPEKWDGLIWPELLLAVDAGTGKITLMNGLEVRPFIEARFEELDHKVKTNDSLRDLTFLVDKLRVMLKNDESLCFWLTQPLQFMGHGQVIEAPAALEADLTQIMINSEKADTLQRTYRVTRTEEEGNHIRYTRKGSNTLLFPGYKKAANNLIPTPTTTSQEEWLVNEQNELIGVSRQSTTTSNSQVNSLDIERSMHIVRLEE